MSDPFDQLQAAADEARDLARERLNRAAPALLAALERCLRYGDLLPELAEEARAAIEKATH